MRRKSEWFPPVYILAQSEKSRGCGGSVPHLKVILSKLVLGGQLQVDPVIGMADSAELDRNRFPISVPIRYRVAGNDVY